MSAAPFVQPDPESQLHVFTRRSTPGHTFPLILASVAVAVVALHVDDVARYSDRAFWVGVLLAVALSWGIGKVVGLVGGRARVAAALALPTVGGALIGMIVQGLVWWDVRDVEPVRDLGGLVDTTELVPWVLSGIVLGGVPALVVAVFLALAARALRKLVGHDANEAFAVVFVGASGMAAALGLLFVRADEAAPLIVSLAASFVSVLVAVLVDGARIRFLRQAFSGADGAFEIVPAERFAADPTLAPVVAQAGAARVLLRVDRHPGSYRAAAAQPIALLADTEAATTAPVRRRRVLASTMLVSMSGLAALAALAHGLFA